MHAQLISMLSWALPSQEPTESHLNFVNAPLLILTLRDGKAATEDIASGLPLTSTSPSPRLGLSANRPWFLTSRDEYILCTSSALQGTDIGYSGASTFSLRVKADSCNSDKLQAGITLRTANPAGACCSYEMRVVGCSVQIKGPSRESSWSVVGELEAAKQHHVAWVVENREGDTGPHHAPLQRWRHRVWVLVDGELGHEELPEIGVDVGQAAWSNLTLCVEKTPGVLVSHLAMFSTDLTQEEIMRVEPMLDHSLQNAFKNALQSQQS